MKNKPIFLLLAVTLMAGANCNPIAVAATGQAASKAPGTAAAQVNSSALTPINTAGFTQNNLTPPRGKMRGLTTQMRWAAAARNANRKARARVKVHVPVNHGGVSQ